MVTTHNEKSAVSNIHLHVDNPPSHHEDPIPFTLAKNLNPTFQPMLLHNKLMIHHHKAGLNPLVDAAAYVFSSIGQIKNLQVYRNLSKLQKEFLEEINTFEVSAKSHGYSSEYIVVSRYALVATIDDIITNTAWGREDWHSFSLLDVFNQDAGREDRFFMILERITKDPKIYIDVMELMYICLSLGYKGSYRQSDENNQLETLTHALYQHIRAHHGDYSKTLSPFPVRPKPITKTETPKISYWFLFFITGSIIMLLFIGLGYFLDHTSNQSYEALMHIGKSILYESNPT
ncbi:MAG TPA: type IVB secretion system protein IcmH/DotU [Gammaproteobacteria bacterium]|nr:type IVB secretion system protein IcmH/DotU [Gammaproteobacteria bacterium]